MNQIYKRYFKTVASIWAGCFVLFFIVYMYLLAPEQRMKKHIKKELIEKKRIYESALIAAQEKTRIKLEEQIGNLRNSLKDFVIDFEDSANLTLDISQIAGDKKVASFSIKDKDNRRSRSTEIPGCEHICENHIKISFGARFDQFAAFLNALERHRPVLFVDKFKVIRSEKDDSEHPVDMDLAVFVRNRRNSGTLAAI